MIPNDSIFWMSVNYWYSRLTTNKTLPALIIYISVLLPLCLLIDLLFLPHSIYLKIRSEVELRAHAYKLFSTHMNLPLPLTAKQKKLCHHFIRTRKHRLKETPNAV